MAYPIGELMTTNDGVEARIRDGIEQNRKGDFVVHAPAGARVTVRLKNHKFRFGCNMFMLDEIPDDPAKNETYKEKLSAFFNMATVPFYWDATEPEEGKTRYAADSEKIYRRPPTDLCVDFCEQHGMEPREHALCYDNFFPVWLRDRSVEEIKAHIERRMQEISSRYAARIPTIEVTNEMFWGRGRTAFYACPDYVEFCFKMAEKYFPNNILAINEWWGLWDAPQTPWDNYACYIENTLLRGARIDAIGMQYHMCHRAENYFDKTRKFYNKAHLFAALDNYARFEIGRAHV